MNTTIHKADSRGRADLGWLQTFHTFSFSSYYNPERVHFGALRVLNDDFIAPGRGFNTHPHDNMEIITIMLEGALRHQDSMGNEYVIKAGEVQRMSAGTGITHSEVNHLNDATTNLLQLWVFPKVKNIEPSYGQKLFEPSGRKNKLQYVVAPDERDGAISINQDAYFSRADLGAGSDFKYDIQHSGNGVYIFVIRGTVKIGDTELLERDAIGIRDTSSVKIKASENCELLFIEVPV